MNRFIAYYYQRIKPHFLQKPLSTHGSENPFFILSAGRSGSTLLRKLLLMNSAVNIPPESDDLIPKLIKFYLRYNHKPWDYIVKGCSTIFNNEPAVQYWNAHFNHTEVESLIHQYEDKSLAGIVRSFYRYYACYHNLHDERWGDKTPFLVFRFSWINMLYPDAKYIFLIRDSRAVVSSFLQMNKGYTVETASDRWLKALEAMYVQAKGFKKRNIIFIKYEDLVSDPERELNKVLFFLDITRLPNRENVFLGDGMLPHYRNIHSPINSSFIDKWKKELTPEQILKITSLTQKKLKKLGYI